VLLTPLVFVAWGDRGELMRPVEGRLSWRALRRAATAPTGWRALGGPPEWGFLKIGHADPTLSGAGLQALLLMTLEHRAGRVKPRVRDLLDPRLQGVMRDLERGVYRVGTSGSSLMEDFVRYGPSRYDVAVTSEAAAISQIERGERRWGSVRVYYPPVTVWSEHVVAVLQGSWATEADRKAAASLSSHLRGGAAQVVALRLGFRPTETGVGLDTPTPDNPFYRLRAQGIQIELPASVEPPSVDYLRNLLVLWRRVARTPVPAVAAE
jgi:hypothetical protein